MTALLTLIRDNRDDWPVLREILADYPYAADEPRTTADQLIGDWTPADDSWFDVIRAVDFGWITRAQYAEIERLVR